MNLALHNTVVGYQQGLLVMGVSGAVLRGNKNSAVYLGKRPGRFPKILKSNYGGVNELKSPTERRVTRAAAKSRVAAG